MLCFVCDVTIAVTYTVTQCYGHMMALQCDETSRIRILEDVFKVAPSIDLHDVHTSCRHKTAGCSLAPPSGVVRRYCEGRRVRWKYSVY